jgi:hypothetical protein
MPLREVVDYWKAGKIDELFARMQRKMRTFDKLFPDREE